MNALMLASISLLTDSGTEAATPRQYDCSVVRTIKQEWIAVKTSPDTQGQPWLFLPTASFRRDLLDQIFHRDLIDALVADHLCAHKNASQRPSSDTQSIGSDVS